MSIDVAETHAEIAEAIEEAAKVVSHEVFDRFCGKPETYTIGSYAGENEALAAALGRAPTDEETARLEPAVVEAIYETLGEMADRAAG